MGIISRAGDLFYAFRFLKLLVTPFEKTEAFKLEIIDKDGNLKGLFVPDNVDDELDFVPDSIVQILEKVYGMNMGDEVTMH